MRWYGQNRGYRAGHTHRSNRWLSLLYLDTHSAGVHWEWKIGKNNEK